MAEDFVFGPAELTDEVVARKKAQLSGVWHGHDLTPLDPRPGDAVRVGITVGPQASGREAWCYFTTDGSAPRGRGGVAENGTAVRFRSVSVDWEDLVWGYVERLEACIPGQPEGTEVRYIIECDGVFADGGEGSATRTPYYGYVVDSWRTPDWIRDAVMYYVMPDRFYPGDGRSWRQRTDLSQPMGGTLRGVLDKLPYIQDMGFNCLWLMPWATGPTYHKYGATDFYQVDPAFGTNDDLRQLIDAAHRVGMRVIVDFVANHCSDQHPFFVSATTDPDSPYRDWFTFRDWPRDYLSFFEGGELPHLALENPGPRQYIIDLARFWVREYGIDGYDLDYAVGPAHNFWSAFSHAVRQERDDVVIFTEGVTTPESLRTYVGRVDGCQDFAWCQAARRTFATGRYTIEEFDRFLTRSEAFFPDGFVAPTMIDNQNMDRFLSLAGNHRGRLRVAAACQYTLSQPLSVWAGTEMGMTQDVSAGGDLNNIRHATAWGDEQDKSIVDWFRRLGAIRRDHVSLRRGRRTSIIADNETGILAYRKDSPEDSCLVVLNASDRDQSVRLPAEAGTYTELLTGTSLTTDGHIDVPVGAWSAAILVQDRDERDSR